MSEISELAAALDASDTRYGAFAERLTALAISYQEKAILSLVKQFLNDV